MFDILEKFNVFSNISEDLKQNIKLFHIFGGNNIFITNEDEVFALGINSSGQCGLGHDSVVQTPTEISLLSGKQIKQFFFGYEFVLGLTQDNRVYGWGRNGFGQLGRGFLSAGNDCLKPKIISELKSIVSINCGNYHSLALDSEHNVFGWGHNVDGQVGCEQEHGLIIDSPVHLTLLPKIKLISCFGNRSFAVTADGLVYSWGSNYVLGHPNTISERKIFKPRLINGLNNVKSIGCCDNNTYFLTNERIIYFCGRLDRFSSQDQPVILVTPLRFESLLSNAYYSRYVLALCEETVYYFENKSINRTDYKTYFDYFSDKSKDTFETSRRQFIKLGSGGFGTVWKWFNKLENKDFALKIIELKDDDSKLYAENEIDILSNCNKDYVVEYFGSWIDQDQYFIQMELCSNNLNNIIKDKRICFKRQTLDEMSLIEGFICSQLMKEILESVQYLHELNPNPIIHRDLKPQNILVNNQQKDGRFIKICDFGLAGFRSKQSLTCSNRRGTPQYMAPELLSADINGRNKYDTKADVYSLGKIFFDLFDFDINSSTVNNGLYDQIRKMLIVEYEKRPGCRSVLDQFDCWATNLNQSVIKDDQQFEENLNQIKEFNNKFFINYFKTKTKILNYDIQSELSSSSSQFDSESDEDWQTPDEQIDETCLIEIEMNRSLNVLFNQIFDSLNIFDGQNIKLFYPLDANNILIETFSGEMYGYGSNEFGQCGSGHCASLEKPNIIPELFGNQFKQIVFGSEFVLAINQQNRVFCWGSNDCGQLGRGFTSSTFEYLKPKIILNLDNIKAISCGSKHSLALDFEGNVFGWGNNDHGQVGSQILKNISSPVLLELQNIKSIHCFNCQSFSVTTDGQVYSWGLNHHLRHQKESEDNLSFKPQLVNGLKNVLTVSFSGVFPMETICFLTNEGIIYFWGTIDFDNSPKILETELKFQTLHSNCHYRDKLFYSDLFATSYGTLYDLKFSMKLNNIKKTKYKTFSDYCLDLKHNIFENICQKILKSLIRYKYEQATKLDTGNSGSVFKARDKIDNKIYALKIMEICEEEIKSFIAYEKEVKMLSKCDDKYVVKYLNSGIDKEKFFIQMDLFNDNLKNIIKEKKDCFEREGSEEMLFTEYFISIQIMIEILECVQYLHESDPPIIHRDLKPANILINYEPMADVRFIKICDFGLATFGADQTITHSMWKGTPQYMAPEVLTGGTNGRNKYSQKADVYSLGKIFCDLFDLDIYSSKPNTELKRMITLMLNDVPKERPTCSQVLFSVKLWAIGKNDQNDIKQMEQFRNKFFYNYYVNH